MLTAETLLGSIPPNAPPVTVRRGGNRGNRKITYPASSGSAARGLFNWAVSMKFGKKKARFSSWYEFNCFCRDFSVTGHIANQA
jgi:hypothetical protein